MSRFQIPLREWDYRLFRLRYVDSFRLRAEFNVQGDKLTMKIDNQSGKDLLDCTLLLPGQRHPLGEIRARRGVGQRIFFGAAGGQ